MCNNRGKDNLLTDKTLLAARRRNIVSLANRMSNSDDKHVVSMRSIYTANHIGCFEIIKIYLKILIFIYLKNKAIFIKNQELILENWMVTDYFKNFWKVFRKKIWMNFREKNSWENYQKHSWWNLQKISEINNWKNHQCSALKIYKGISGKNLKISFSTIY